MTPQEVLEILHVAERLKCNTRHCDTSTGRRESVAEHSWRLCLFAMLLEQEPEFRSLDTDRVLRMCLIHDLGEAFTGDIPAFSKSAQDEGREQALYEDWIAQFPPANRAQFQALLAEMTALATPEAKLYKALDKLEAVIQHNEASLDSWLPLEYDLQRTYGQEAVEFSPYLRALKAEIDRWTEEKIAAAQPQAQRSEIRD
ncbi:MAG: HD domain-containing protein [Oscillospiraceae bacterium]|mgnify:CR=1 FL=1|nr:HD domain-containing protein [Oscillospiraceae bacterium]